MIKAFLSPDSRLYPTVMEGEIDWGESSNNRLVLNLPGGYVTIDTNLIDVVIEDEETVKLWQAYYNDC